MSEHILHLIECQCTLSIFKNNNKPVYHKIPVFSIIENDSVNEKYIICENCNVVHRVTEVSKSEIMWGVEGLESLAKSIEDIKFNLESMGFQSLISLLEKHDVHVSKWEKVEYCLENKIDENIVLQKNEHNNNIIITLLEISNNNFKIKKEIVQRYL